MRHSFLNVVSNPLSDDPADLLLAYWNELRRETPIPYRADIHPTALATALDHAFILQATPGCGARFRLTGRLLNDLMGMDMRGMQAATLFAPHSRIAWADTVSSVFRTPAAVICTLSAAGRYGAPGLSAKLLMLPLLDNMGQITRAIGTIAIRGDIGETPRRFDAFSVTQHDALCPIGPARGQHLPINKTPALPAGKPALCLVK